jgi:hypothetical protein
MSEVIEGHEDVGVVVACCLISAFPEYSPETRPRSYGRPARSVVDHTVLGEKVGDLVIEPVIDAVRIAVNEVDDLVLVD